MQQWHQLQQIIVTLARVLARDGQSARVPRRSPERQMQVLGLSMVILWMPHNIPSAASISLGHTLEYLLSSTDFSNPLGLSRGWISLVLPSF